MVVLGGIIPWTLHLADLFTRLDDGIGLSARENAAAHYSGAFGRHRSDARQRLHIGAWGLRHIAALTALFCGNPHLYDNGDNHGRRDEGIIVMKNNTIALVAGLLFGFGLSLSGMGDPQNVIGFLDLFGRWNPQLIFVMVGAIITTFIGFSLMKQKVEWGGSFKDIDAKLIVGASLFGIGWGIAGYCPGPAFIGLNTGYLPIFYFVLAMLLGMWGTRFFTSR
jgi:uncharacterized protein